MCIFVPESNYSYTEEEVLATKLWLDVTEERARFLLKTTPIGKRMDNLLRLRLMEGFRPSASEMDAQRILKDERLKRILNETI